MLIKRVKIHVKGLVQGVGFRPFVYKLAQEFSLAGFVYNSGEGVFIELEGFQSALLKAMDKLKYNSPPLAKVQSVLFSDMKIKNEKFFYIKPSVQTAIKTILPNDISMCDRCKSEMKNPSDRRYNYPFINCTNCGPRYTIIKGLPYDRAKSSMSKFNICNRCKKEYEDPLSRRFHAQPISCHDCGPSLYLLNLAGETIYSSYEAIQELCKAVERKNIVAVKGLGGFHIVCDARDEESVLRLRDRKNRPSKPLAVMFKDIDKIKEVALVSKEEESLILSKERPIVLVNKKISKYLADSIAPNVEQIGVFLPYTPLHEMILDILDFPIVATSANLSDEPIITQEKVLLQKLSTLVDFILSHDREIVNGCDDSVCTVVEGKKMMLRMARGYAPLSTTLKKKSNKNIIALGANQKSNISMIFDNSLITSAHIGDLNSLESISYFEQTVKLFYNFYNFVPDIVVCDMHPGYESTKWAKNYVKKNPKTKLLEVQHHYAHALCCMAEHALDEKLLAFCFDGTGYADNKALWGGEVLVADTLGYERVKYFKPFRLLGGEKAIQEPNRVALSLLFDIYSLDEVLKMRSEVVKSFKEDEIKTLHLMHKKGLNSPLSSSVGRIFDAVLSLSGIAQDISYEGESGAILANLAQNSQEKSAFTYYINENEIDYQEMIREIVTQTDVAKTARMLINTLTDIIIEVSSMYPDLAVVFTGGVFQNHLLVSQLTQRLKEQNRDYYMHKKTPVNDGGISIGQAYHAYFTQMREYEK